MIGEGQRGATLESLLTKVRMLTRKSSLNVLIDGIVIPSLRSAQPQIIGMSATLANIDDLLKYLDAQFYEERFRPVQTANSSAMIFSHVHPRSNWKNTSRSMTLSTKSIEKIPLTRVN